MANFVDACCEKIRTKCTPHNAPRDICIALNELATDIRAMTEIIEDQDGSPAAGITPPITFVDVADSITAILPADATRRGGSLQNISDEPIWIAFGTQDPTVNETIRIDVGATFQLIVQTQEANGNAPIISAIRGIHADAGLLKRLIIVDI